jgi:hypothetical protein
MVRRKWRKRLDHPVGADLGRDLARSGSNPVSAFFQQEMRRPVYDGYAADRDQGLLPQDFPQTCEPDAAMCQARPVRRLSRFGAMSMPV